MQPILQLPKQNHLQFPPRFHLLGDEPFCNECVISDSAYTLYDRDFLNNVTAVLLYAVIGTLINVFAIGYGLYGLNYVGAMGTQGGGGSLDGNWPLFGSLFQSIL